MTASATQDTLNFFVYGDSGALRRNLGAIDWLGSHNRANADLNLVDVIEKEICQHICQRLGREELVYLATDTNNSNRFGFNFNVLLLA